MKWLVVGEEKIRWLAGGLALLALVYVFLLLPSAESLGIAGSGPRKHDPAMVYSSLNGGDYVVEYAFRNFEDCNAYRSEMIAKSLLVSECKSGDEVDASTKPGTTTAD